MPTEVPNATECLEMFYASTALNRLAKFVGVFDIFKECEEDGVLPSPHGALAWLILQDWIYCKLLIRGVGMLSWNLRLAFRSSWLKWYRFVEVARETIFGAHVKHSAHTHAVCRLSICTLPGPLSEVRYFALDWRRRTRYLFCI